jgi:hypothetical protein
LSRCDQSTSLNLSDNSPPGAPTIDGPPSGKVRETYQYQLSSTDPDNNNVYLFVMWGDGTQTEWVGPYNSSEVVTLSHKWKRQGTFNISAKAKDIYGYQSTWSNLETTMPRPLLLLFLLYHILQYLQSLRSKIANLYPN